MASSYLLQAKELVHDINILTIHPTEMQGCMAAVYEWADSYDSKDWKRLEKCIAPTLRIDYRSFLNKIWEAMPAEEFIKMVSSNPKPTAQPSHIDMTLGIRPKRPRRSLTEDPTLHRRHQMGESQRRRDHRLPPIASPASEIQGLQHAGGCCEGSCA